MPLLFTSPPGSHLRAQLAQHVDGDPGRDHVLEARIPINLKPQMVMINYNREYLILSDKYLKNQFILADNEESFFELNEITQFPN